MKIFKKEFLLKRLISVTSTESSMRFIALLVIINVMAVWSAVCLKNLNIADIPEGVLWLVGIVTLGKVSQRAFERGDEPQAGKGEPDAQ